ncbi:MAG: tetratricopeptide repeat protein [Alphaproteobacteria bacterium]
MHIQRILLALALLLPATVRADTAAGLAALARGDLAGGRVLLQVAASEGDAEAAYQVGLIYDAGRGVPADPAQALKWFTQAAEAGHAEAARVVGIYYEEGKGVAQDHTQSARWYGRAANAGNAKAQRNLGSAYALGRGVPRDYEQAARWFRAAADQGNADAQRNLAYLYFFGRGVPRDEARATELFAAAASANADGAGKADYALGFSYYNGRGVERDFAAALAHFKVAANKGNADAQIFLARMYLNGEGTAKDPFQSYYWALLGGLQKPELAAYYFDELRPLLTDADRAAVRRGLSEFTPDG